MSSESDSAHDSSLDNEELESRLYSEIYYSNDVDFISGKSGVLESEKTENMKICALPHSDKETTVHILQNSETQYNDDQTVYLDDSSERYTCNNSKVNSSSSLSIVHPVQDENSIVVLDKSSISQKRSLSSLDQDGPRTKVKKVSFDDEVHLITPIRLRKKASKFISSPERNLETTCAQKSSINFKSNIISDNISKCMNTNSKNEIVIDITSEDSEDENSKYNTPSVSEKISHKQGINLALLETNLDSGDDSDSDESIYEIPVPPKPAPLLIDLKDSDNEQQNSNQEVNSDNSDIDSNLPSIHFKSNDFLEDLDSIIEFNSDSEESESLILNCTEIEKAASNLDEINQSNNKSLIDQNNVPSTTERCLTIQPLQCNTSSKHISSVTKSQKNISTRNVQNVPEELYFFQPMSEKMKKFYDESWGGEDFEVDRVQRTMSRRNNWKILKEDLFPSPYTRKKKLYGIFCHKCKKEGHRTYTCTEPEKLPVCYMCGIMGHEAPACPHTMCLTCGRIQSSYSSICNTCRRMKCKRCNSIGHIERTCPDLWRRYHSTIKSVQPYIPRYVMKSYTQLSCSNCSLRGHDSSQCKRYRADQHFLTPSCVVSYDDPASLNNSVSKPCQDSFSLDTLNQSTPIISNASNESVNSHSYCEASAYKNIKDSNLNRVSENLAVNKTITLISIRSNRVKEGRKTIDCSMKLNLPPSTYLNSYNNWQMLETFLLQGSKACPLKLDVLKLNNEIHIEVRCWTVLKQFLLSILKQYTLRNDYERDLMYFNWSTSKSTLFEKFNNEMKRLYQMKDDPMELHSKIMQLKSHLNTDSKNLVKLKELAETKTKLIMILHREGFLDNSLMKLQNVIVTAKRRDDRHVSAFTMPSLLKFIYFFNNIFAPYDLKDFNSIIKNYKNQMQMRNNMIKNYSMFFPTVKYDEIQNKTPDSSQILLNNSTSSVRSFNSSDALICNEVPLLEVDQMNVVEEINTIVNALPCINKSPENIVSENNSADTVLLTNNMVGKKKMNGLFHSFSTCKNPIKKQQFEKQFQNFILKTQSLLERAYSVNDPVLNKHANLLEQRMLNPIYVTEKEVKKFKRQVKLASKQDNYAFAMMQSKATKKYWKALNKGKKL